MPEAKKYHGVVVPMVTPFTDSGEIDIPAARRVTEHIVAAAFVLGTTGEAASVPQRGRAEFVEAAVKQTAGRALTYAGIASNCFKTSVDAAGPCVQMVETADDIGSQNGLLISPELYRKFIKPLEKQFYSLIREKAPQAFIRPLSSDTAMAQYSK
ncbi:MAG: dihydrodipicolinate synthase family protein [Planctomycetota bacterium]|jgi:dihydrodipicolinate synthase/N-acetylneuraminate lyase